MGIINALCSSSKIISVWGCTICLHLSVPFSDLWNRIDREPIFFIPKRSSYNFFFSKKSFTFTSIWYLTHLKIFRFYLVVFWLKKTVGLCCRLCQCNSLVRLPVSLFLLFFHICQLLRFWCTYRAWFIMYWANTAPLNAMKSEEHIINIISLQIVLNPILHGS